MQAQADPLPLLSIKFTFSAVIQYFVSSGALPSLGCFWNVVGAKVVFSLSASYPKFIPTISLNAIHSPVSPKGILATSSCILRSSFSLSSAIAFNAGIYSADWAASIILSRTTLLCFISGRCINDLKNSDSPFFAFPMH